MKIDINENNQPCINLTSLEISFKKMVGAVKVMDVETLKAILFNN